MVDQQDQRDQPLLAQLETLGLVGSPEQLVRLVLARLGLLQLAPPERQEVDRGVLLDLLAQLAVLASRGRKERRATMAPTEPTALTASSPDHRASPVLLDLWEQLDQVSREQLVRLETPAVQELWDRLGPAVQAVRGPQDLPDHREHKDRLGSTALTEPMVQIATSRGLKASLAHQAQQVLERRVQQEQQAPAGALVRRAPQDWVRRVQAAALGRQAQVASDPRDTREMTEWTEMMVRTAMSQGRKA